MLSKEQVFELFNMSEKKQYQKRGRYRKPLNIILSNDPDLQI